MRRLVALLAVGGVTGGLAFVLMHRARSPRGEPIPAPASAPVHMAVGDAAPQVAIPGEADIGMP